MSSYIVWLASFLSDEVGDMETELADVFTGALVRASVAFAGAAKIVRECERKCGFEVF